MLYDKMKAKRGETMVDFDRTPRYSEAAEGRGQLRVNRRAETSPDSMRGYHYHDEYELYYLQRGERYYFICDRSYHVREGTLVLIAPHEIHCTTAMEGVAYERVLVSFSRASLLPYVRALGEKENPLALFERGVHTVSFDAETRPLVEGLLTQMERAYARGEVGRLGVGVAMLLLLATDAAGDGVRADEEGYLNATHRLISEVTGYINTHYAEPLSLETLSGIFYVSACYLSRIFRRYTGSSFVEYLSAVRIKEAKRRLASTGESVTEIALGVGFRSVTHFGRVFRELIGLSPLAFRRVSLSGNDPNSKRRGCRI